MRIKCFQHRFTTNTIEGILEVNSKSGHRMITKLQGMLKIMDNRLTSTRYTNTKLDGLKDGLGNLLNHKLTTIGSYSIGFGDSFIYFTFNYITNYELQFISPQIA